MAINKYGGTGPSQRAAIRQAPKHAELERTTKGPRAAGPKKQIRRLRNQVQKLQTHKSELEQRATQLREQISEQQESIDQTRGQISETRVALQETEGELGELGHRLRRKHHKLAIRLDAEFSGMRRKATGSTKKLDELERRIKRRIDRSITEIENDRARRHAGYTRRNDRYSSGSKESRKCKGAKS